MKDEITQVEFNEAIQGLILKGLVEPYIKDGQKKYRLTNIGKKLHMHMNSADSKMNNYD